MCAAITMKDVILIASSIWKMDSQMSLKTAKMLSIHCLVVDLLCYKNVKFKSLLKLVDKHHFVGFFNVIYFRNGIKKIVSPLWNGTFTQQIEQNNSKEKNSTTYLELLLI